MKRNILLFILPVFLTLTSCQYEEGPAGPRGATDLHPDGFFRVQSTGLYTLGGTPYAVDLEFKYALDALAAGIVETRDANTLGFHFNRYQDINLFGSAYVSIYTNRTATVVTGANLNVLFDHFLDTNTKTTYQADGNYPEPASTGDTLRFQRFVYDSLAGRIQGEFTLSRPAAYGNGTGVLRCTFDCAARKKIQ